MHYDGLKLRRPFSLTAPSLSMEMIDFQKDTFGADIEKIVTEIQQTLLANFDAEKSRYPKEMVDKLKRREKLHPAEYDKLTAVSAAILAKSDFAERLEALIFNRLGIRTKISFSSSMYGATFIMQVTDKHILTHDMWKNSSSLKQHIKKLSPKDGQQGSVDLHRAKVSGLFSQYTHKCFVGFGVNVLDVLLTPAEITAIILHELGHAFTFYEYSDRINATNQVIASVAEELIKPKEKRNYTYIYTELKEKADITAENIVDLLNTTDRNILAGKLWLATLQCYYKQSKAGKYEETSSEQLADQFANRFGYGRALITGLEKIENRHGPLRNPRILALLILIQLYFLFIGPAIAISGGSIAAYLVGSMYLLSAFLVVYVTGSAVRFMDYDQAKQRYTRIRQDAIQALKQQFYSEEDTRALIDSIKQLDAIIEKTSSVSIAAIYPVLSDLIFSINRQAKKDINYQQLIERLMSNDLFLKAAELKNAAGHQ